MRWLIGSRFSSSLWRMPPPCSCYMLNFLFDCAMAACGDGVVVACWRHPYHAVIALSSHQVEVVRERGMEETRILTSAVALAEENKNKNASAGKLQEVICLYNLMPVVLANRKGRRSGASFTCDETSVRGQCRVFIKHFLIVSSHDFTPTAVIFAAALSFKAHRRMFVESGDMSSSIIDEPNAKISSCLGSQSMAQVEARFFVLCGRLFCFSLVSCPRQPLNVHRPRVFCVVQVVLKEGGDLSALTGLLGCSVAAVRLLTEREGGGVCLTLREDTG